MRRGEKRWKDLRVYIHVVGTFFVFLLLCLSAFFGAVKKSIEQNVRQTITANIDRQSAAFSSAITIQYQYLEGFAGYLGEIGELCSENVMTLMRKVCEKSDLERIAIIAPDGTAHYSSGEVKNVAERDYFKQAMQGERCLSDPLESAVDGETRVILCVPVYHDGEVAGVLGGSYDVGALSHMLFEDIYGGAGYSLIVTSDGEIVAYDGSEEYRKIQLDDNVFSYYAQMTFLEGDTFEMMRDGFANRTSGSVKLGRDGDFRYLSYAPIDVNDWMMCYIVPEKIVEAPYRTITRYETILMGMVLLGMAALVAYVFCMMLKRQKELDRLFSKLYEDWAAERITEYNFKVLSEKYQTEQADVLEKIERLQAELATEQQTVVNIDQWIGLIQQYAHPEELTAEMLNALIEKIVVHEKTVGEDGEKEQIVDIYYRFVGKID